MPRAHPREFRDDVVAVARRGDAPIAQIAKDFGISESCLRRWLERADVADGVRPGSPAAEPYYRWLAHPVGDRELAEAYLANALFDAHHDDPEFGYRLLADEARETGHIGCDRTVWRVCAAKPVVVDVREEARQERQTARAAGPRRPGRTRLHRPRTQPAVADRHHRTLDR